MKNGYLKKETEGLIMAAQDQSLQIRWVQHYTDKTTDSPKRKMCRKMDENISHIVSECDKVAALLQWQ